jgi:hypothetical protein
MGKRESTRSIRTESRREQSLKQEKDEKCVLQKSQKSPNHQTTTYIDHKKVHILTQTKGTKGNEPEAEP